MRRTRRVHPAFKIFVLAFAVYAAFTVVSLRLQIQKKEAEMAAIQQQIDAQKLENSQIADILNTEDESEYVAQIAREKLGYITPGQYVFVDISSK